MIIHVVEAGDTLDSIAREYGVPLSRVIQQNELDENRQLTIGQNIVITFADEVYTVKDGDTISSIAEMFGVSIIQLYQNNPQLKGRPQIFEGQTIIISYRTEKNGSMAVNGYIYPFIERETLYRTLPYLTFLTIFTYGFNLDGTLVDGGITDFGIDEDELIEISKQYGVAPIMHLSTLTPEGVFNSSLGNAILNDVGAQEILIENIVKRMNEKGYYGFDVDFEYLDSSSRDLYTDFVARLRVALQENGYILITALIPKSSKNQAGSLYESHDYEGIAKASDYVLLMTYEWGYAFGPPMAVAPLNEVTKVVDYALTEMPSDKIFLGIPNYAYDWKLPYVKGQTKAEKLTNEQAVKLAVEKGVPISFDETSAAPYFNYLDEPDKHVVWFDDAVSIRDKLELVSSRNLYGASYWNVMQYFAQNWLVLNQLYDIEKLL